MTHEIPLRVEVSTHLPAARCAADLVALSSATGIWIRPPRPNEVSWKVSLQVESDHFRFVLYRPDGGFAAAKSVARARASCQAVTEFLAILLAAHVPEVTLPYPFRAQRRPSPSPKRVWQVVGGAGVSGLGKGMGPLLAAKASVVFWRGLSASAQLAVDLHRQDVAPGRATIWALAGRASVGYLRRWSRFGWSGGGLLGGRLTHAYGEGLTENRSASLGALELGVTTDVWIPVTDHLLVGWGMNLLWTLPRPAFTVTGPGLVYETPAPTIELLFAAGWGS